MGDWSLRERVLKFVVKNNLAHENVRNMVIQNMKYDTSAYVREKATETLGKLHLENEHAIEALLECLINNEEWVAREKAAKSLGKLSKNPKVIHGLIHALKNDPHELEKWNFERNF